MMKMRSITLSMLCAAGLVSATAASASVSGGDRLTNRLAPAIAPPASKASAPEGDCQKAVWPYIPAHCMRNADPERIRRPVRIIRIDALNIKSLAPAHR
jgi:hypothetical protein